MTRWMTSIADAFAAGRRAVGDGAPGPNDRQRGIAALTVVMVLFFVMAMVAAYEKPLVALRHSLRRLGLERPDTVTETEDHLASLCEVMRYLIAGDDLAVSNLEQQRRFFGEHLRPWVDTLCDSLVAHPRADFYRALAHFTRDFFAVESQAFDLLDA